MKRKNMLFFLLVSLLFASLACSALSLGGSEEENVATEVVSPEVDSEQPTSEEEMEEEAPPTEESMDSEETEAETQPEEGEEQSEFDTEFPLPSNVTNFMGAGGDAQVNFQTNMTIEESIEFYRNAFSDQGLTEREINTAITDTTFSMVFDGHDSGKAIVVQGVALGESNTNINIRFEDV